MLTLMNDHTRECLTIDVARKLNSENVRERLNDLFLCRGMSPPGVCKGKFAQITNATPIE